MFDGLMEGDDMMETKTICGRYGCPLPRVLGADGCGFHRNYQIFWRFIDGVKTHTGIVIHGELAQKKLDALNKDWDGEKVFWMEPCTIENIKGIE